MLVSNINELINWIQVFNYFEFLIKGLADVYNDDLEEDNSDYNEEGEEDEDVDEDSDDDADETAEKIEGAEGEAECKKS